MSKVARKSTNLNTISRLIRKSDCIGRHGSAAHAILQRFRANGGFAFYVTLPVLPRRARGWILTRDTNIATHVVARTAAAILQEVAPWRRARSNRTRDGVLERVGAVLVSLTRGFLQELVEDDCIVELIWSEA